MPSIDHHEYLLSPRYWLRSTILLRFERNCLQPSTSWFKRRPSQDIYEFKELRISESLLAPVNVFPELLIFFTSPFFFFLKSFFSLCESRQGIGFISLDFHITWHPLFFTVHTGPLRLNFLKVWSSNGLFQNLQLRVVV